MGEVDVLLNHLSEQWQHKDNSVDVHQNSKLHTEETLQSVSLVAQAHASVVEHSADFKAPQGAISGLVPTVLNKSIQHDDSIVNKQPETVGNDRSRKLLCGDRRSSKRTTSCPPGRTYFEAAGPWSLEWINRDKNNVLVHPLQSEPRGHHSSSSGAPRVIKKKGGNKLRHCARNLKRIARLSKKDQKDVLCALQKTHRRRRPDPEVSKDKVNGVENSSQSGSQASINNDWKNWLVLHGSDQAKSDDVRGFGKIVGLKFKGDKNNMFDVLSWVGRKNSEGGRKE